MIMRAVIKSLKLKYQNENVNVKLLNYMDSRLRGNDNLFICIDPEINSG